MPTPVGRKKDAHAQKTMNEKRRAESRAAVIKYADGERTRDEVIRMSGASRVMLRSLEKELGLKFGRAW